MKLLVVGLLILIVLAAAVAIANRTASPAGGLESGRLKPCPDRPNCVASVGPDGRVAPLRFEGTPESARDGLKRVMAGIPRTVLVEESAYYLHYTATSRIFRFVDDVEFQIGEEDGQVQIRSASRLGYSDLGANLERVERIQSLWEKLAGDDATGATPK